MKLTDRIKLLKQYEYTDAFNIIKDFKGLCKIQGDDDQIDLIKSELELSDNDINKLSNWNSAIKNLKYCIENLEDTI